MAARQHETVAVGPGGVGGVEFQEAREQHRGDIGHAQRQARMPRFGGLDRVQGQHPDGIGKMAGLSLIGRGHGRSFSAKRGVLYERGPPPSRVAAMPLVRSG